MYYYRLIKKFILFLFLCWPLSSCVTSENDIYSKVSMGSHLSRDVIENSTQFLRSEGQFLIILYNTSEDWRYINNHILVYNARRKLIEATYIPVKTIDSISENTIYGVSNKVMQERANLFHNEPLNTFRIKLVEGIRSTSMKISNKLILSMSVDDAFKVRLIVKKASDRFAGLRPYSTDDILEQRFTLMDTIVVPLSDLNFYTIDKKVHLRYRNHCCKVDDIMIADDTKVFDIFFKQLEGII